MLFRKLILGLSLHGESEGKVNYKDISNIQGPTQKEVTSILSTLALYATENKDERFWCSLVAVFAGCASANASKTALMST